MGITGENSPPSLLEVSAVRKYFTLSGGSRRQPKRVHAVDGVSFKLSEGDTLGLVGESGCGKSTLARVVVGLYEPSEGFVRLRGADVHRGSRGAGAIQMVFQDPASSLNPRLRVQTSVTEPVRGVAPRESLKEMAADALARVGLDTSFGARYPGELSGGQQQRVAIARALIAGPPVVVFDEAISSLDVSLQAQVLALIQELQEELKTAYVFITHDLATAMEISGRIAIMYLGEIVELVPAQNFSNLLHPYSQALSAATLTPNPDLERARVHVALKGETPDATDPPPGCRFHTRCLFAQEICRETAPPLLEHRRGQWAACHFAGEVNVGGAGVEIGAA